MRKSKFLLPNFENGFNQDCSDQFGSELTTKTSSARKNSGFRENIILHFLSRLMLDLHFNNLMVDICHDGSSS